MLQRRAEHRQSKVESGESGGSAAWEKRVGFVSVVSCSGDEMKVSIKSFDVQMDVKNKGHRVPGICCVDEPLVSLANAVGS